MEILGNAKNVRICSLKDRDSTFEMFVSGKIQHYKLGARRIVNPRTSLLMKVSEMFCKFGCHTFAPSSWACKKQTAVPHSTEAEVILMDTDLRM